MNFRFDLELERCFAGTLSLNFYTTHFLSSLKLTVNAEKYLKLYGGSKTDGIEFMEVEFFNQFESKFNASYFSRFFSLIARKCGQSRFMLYLGIIETLIFIV